MTDSPYPAHLELDPDAGLELCLRHGSTAGLRTTVDPGPAMRTPAQASIASPRRTIDAVRARTRGSMPSAWQLRAAIVLSQGRPACAGSHCLSDRPIYRFKVIERAEPAAVLP